MKNRMDAILEVEKTRDPRYHRIADFDARLTPDIGIMPAKMTNDSGWRLRSECQPQSISTARHERAMMLWQHAASLMQDCVIVRKHLMSGMPCLAGTRLTLSQIAAQLSAGDSIDDIAEEMEVDRDLLEKLMNGLAIIFSRPMI